MPSQPRDNPEIPPDRPLTRRRSKVLTPRQQEILDFVREQIAANGLVPTVREIGRRFNIKSPNGVACHLKALEKKGAIERESNLSRAIRLTEGTLTRYGNRLPLLGQFAVGERLPCLEAAEQLDFAGLFTGTDHICLRVVGSSPLSDHILTGDVLVVRRQPTFVDGDLVLFADSAGVMDIQRLYRETDRIRMGRPQNTESSRFVDRVIVIGLIVGLIRLYREDA